MPPPPRKVRVKETGKVYESARDCADQLGADFSSIYACLRGQRLTHKGYSYEYTT